MAEKTDAFFASLCRNAGLLCDRASSPETTSVAATPATSPAQGKM